MRGAEGGGHVVQVHSHPIWGCFQCSMVRLEADQHTLQVYALLCWSFQFLFANLRSEEPWEDPFQGSILSCNVSLD